MTQFAMEQVAKIAPLKIDFLGLSNLTILGKAGEIIKRDHRRGDRTSGRSPMATQRRWRC